MVGMLHATSLRPREEDSGYLGDTEVGVNIEKKGKNDRDSCLK